MPTQSFLLDAKNFHSIIKILKYLVSMNFRACPLRNAIFQRDVTARAPYLSRMPTIRGRTYQGDMDSWWSPTRFSRTEVTSLNFNRFYNRLPAIWKLRKNCRMSIKRPSQAYTYIYTAPLITIASYCHWVLTWKHF